MQLQRLLFSDTTNFLNVSDPIFKRADQPLVKDMLKLAGYEIGAPTDQDHIPLLREMQNSFRSRVLTDQTVLLLRSYVADRVCNSCFAATLKGVG